VRKEDKETLFAYGSRIGFTDGYLYKHNGSDMITYQKPSFTQSKDYTGETAACHRIDGCLVIKKEHPISLTVWDEAHEVSVTTGAPDVAQKQPITKEDVGKRIRKTGDTAFLFDDLRVELDEGLFVPNGVLNQLKRDALEQLKESILQDFRRVEPLGIDNSCVDSDSKLLQNISNVPEWKLQQNFSDFPDSISFRNSNEQNILSQRMANFENEKMNSANLCEWSRDGVELCEHQTQQNDFTQCEKHIVSTENRALLPVLLSYDRITHIYLGSTAYSRNNLVAQLSEDVTSCNRAGKQAYFILPSICRADTMRFYRKIAEQLGAIGLDGFVVKNLESFWFVKNHYPQAAVICDHNLYTYNDAAVDAYRNAGANGVTVPFELNRKELAGRGNTDSEIWVYGYYPLMTTAQCVCKNADKCTHTPGVRFLIDRYKKRFAVKNCCSECYNVIYNSLPTMLFSQMKELRTHGIAGYRLHFSIESAGETKKILRLYESFLSGEIQTLPEKEKALYTNGHYKRGVE
jgi:putative protease